ncbi:MAG: hypothetical protein Q8Q85_10840 [Gemmatimonadales bacterium]|nr:hypothetical protein [Gemmatimonadales bacterium]
MFIELTEILRCPAGHDESYVVCVPVEMDGRRVIRGGIGCPVCHAEYAIVDGIAHFGSLGTTPRSSLPGPSYDAAALQAFLDLEGRGGYALLVGAAARLGPEVAALVPGVRFFSVNPPDVVRPSEAFSVLRSPRALPVKTGSVRAVVLGADHAAEPWLTEAVRVLLKGLRLVVENDTAAPEGIAELARGAGLLVGEKLGR